MITGIIRNPVVGSRYRLHLGNGQTLEVIFGGFVNCMSTKWIDAFTNQEIADLPPYIGYETV